MMVFIYLGQKALAFHPYKQTIIEREQIDEAHKTWHNPLSMKNSK
jgi:hypothetical protein